MNSKTLFSTLEKHRLVEQEPSWITVEYLKTHLLGTPFKPPYQATGRGIRLENATLSYLLLSDGSVADALLSHADIVELHEILGRAARNLDQLTAPPISDRRLLEAVRNHVTTRDEDVRF